ncbi:MAG TPA: hypothetical protein VHL98_12550 [Microvirga sp.]|nr:hypothetical protein [Microvirga sp.]
MLVTSARLGYASFKAALCVLFIVLVAQGAGRSFDRTPERVAYAKLIAAADQEPVATGSLARSRSR